MTEETEGIVTCMVFRAIDNTQVHISFLLIAFQSTDFAFHSASLPIGGTYENLPSSHWHIILVTFAFTIAGWGGNEGNNDPPWH